MRRGHLNVHPGPGGTLTSVLSDIEAIWGYALQDHMEIPRKDLKVRDEYVSVVLLKICITFRNTSHFFTCHHGWLD